MVNEGGNGRKKNKSRNKKKNKNQPTTSTNSQVPSTLTEDPTEFVPPPVPPPIVSPSEEIPEQPKHHSKRCTHKAAEEKCEDDLAKNLIEDEDFVAKSYSLSSLQDAEVSFCSYMGQNAAKQSGSEEELDLFASDDEVVEKPKMVKPTPKSKGAKKSDEKNSTLKKTAESSEAPISTTSSNSSSLSAEIARARQHIKSSLEYVDGLAALAGGSDVSGKIAKLESDNAKLHKAVNDLKNVVLTLQDKVAALEKTCGSSASTCGATKKTEDEDEDVDLFGSDSDEEEDAEKVRIREERLKAYHEKKSKKPALIAKTSVLLDVKPWDDETDMDAMLARCKTIQKEGLVWGASKLVPIGYGIKKLQVMCVVEDEKVSIDELCEQIEGFEEFVQSVDVAAMSKI